MTVKAKAPTIPPLFRAAEERFWGKVAMRSSDQCWEWQASKDRRGYGRFDSMIGTLAHRYSWTLANGELPGARFVCHRCDNPGCVNPAHLFLADHLGNMADMWAKGRGLSGDHHPSTKLKSYDLPEVRRRYASGERLRSIARSFGVSVPCISTANADVRHLRPRTRGQRGEQNQQAKLSLQQVTEIRHLSALGVSGVALSREFSVSPSQVSRILKGQSWR